jgi:hypothetical protein
MSSTESGVCSGLGTDGDVQEGGKSFLERPLDCEAHAQDGLAVGFDSGDRDEQSRCVGECRERRFEIDGLWRRPCLTLWRDWGGRSETRQALAVGSRGHSYSNLGERIG